jgi:hypothetical protein
MGKLDQYGNPIPTDLIVLSGEDPADFNSATLERIDKADWYEAEGVLLVSARAIGYAFEGSPLDAGLDLDKTEIFYVDFCLHRWSSEDGFYHA